MDNGTSAQRMAAWAQSLGQFDLPDWDRLPQLDLYMDQVILLLKRYLSPVEGYEDEKSITASIINNYVRMKVMPAPVKKKYSRVHLAYLVVICTLKQSLSISRIRLLLPKDSSEESVRLFYTEFVEQLRSIVAFLRCLPFGDGRLPPETLVIPGNESSLILTSAIFATLSKSLTEYLLQEEPAEGKK